MAQGPVLLMLKWYLLFEVKNVADQLDPASKASENRASSLW